MAKLNYTDISALINYDPYSGTLTWKERSPSLFANGRHSPDATAAAWNKRFAGKPALTSIDDKGYPRGQVMGVYVRAHQVAWLLHSKSWPVGIDHINGDKLDLTISNLRLADQSVNAKNSRKRLDNKSGQSGVRQHPITGRWVANIGVGRKRVHIGYYPTRDEAIAARLERQSALGFSPRHGT